MQIKLAPVYTKSSHGEMTTLPLVIEFGLTDAWQLEAEWNAIAHRRDSQGLHSSGVGDLVIGTEFSAMRIGGRDIHGAVRLEVTLPTGDEEKALGDEDTEIEAYAIVAKDFSSLRQVYIKPLLATEDAVLEWGVNFGGFKSMQAISISMENQYV